MTSRVAARVLLLIAASALLWAGVAFAGYGLFMALLPALGSAGAPLAVAGILLTPPLVALAALFLHGWQSVPAQTVTPELQPGQAGLSILANMAKEKPLLAMLFAGLLSAANALSQKKFR